VMDDQSLPKNFKQLRIDRPILEEEIEEDEEKDSDSIEAIKNQNTINETSEQTTSKKFSISGFGDDIDGKHSSTTLSPSSSLHPIQAVSPILMTSPSAISFSTVMSASPPPTPNPYSKKNNRLRFNIEDDKDSVSTYDGPRRMKSILSDRDLLRLKSLKSVRRHNRDTKAIVLKEEEEEEIEEPPKADEDMGAAIVHTSNHEETPKVDWIESNEARGAFVQYFAFLYALLAIFYLVVEEATDENISDYFPAGIIFHYYMYGVAILFIVYVNLFVIHPPWLNRILYFLSDRGWWKSAERYIIMPASHNAEPVSTLYLRMGTLLFGCAGVVLYGLELYMLFAGKVKVPFVPMSVAENILGIIFTFSQMYFMNVNFKLLVQSSQNICRFGFMHCFALNLWIWYRFAAAKTNKSKKKQVTKEQAKLAAYTSKASYEKYEADASSSLSSESSSEEFLRSNSTTGNGTMDTANDVLTRVVDYLTTTLSPVQNTTMTSSTYLITTTFASTNSTTLAYEEPLVKSTVASLEYFGDFASFLATCLVEYSLIGAAVMFVFWTHLDPSVPQHLHEKKRGVRVDFTASLTGLYLGVVIFILGAVICGVYAALYADCNDHAYILFGVYQLVCFTCCIIAVMAGTLFMRSLVLAGHRHGEDVDFLLLYVAFCGEVIWCSAELARFIDVGGDGFIFAVTLVRLSHVFSQTWFILMACKLELASSTKVTAMRGRQCVTFMLVTNITLFFFHIYESMTEGFGYVSSSSSNHTYVKLLAGPIIAFYRFHCSVCLAEVWKKTFSRPKAHSHHHADHDHLTSPATSPITPLTSSDGHAVVTQHGDHHVYLVTSFSLLVIHKFLGSIFLVVNLIVAVLIITDRDPRGRAYRRFLVMLQAIELALFWQVINSYFSCVYHRRNVIMKEKLR
ncbi:hypothetical protein PENTCL1PPCAC_17194, partial [Pristionchus entomophagus]